MVTVTEKRYKVGISGSYGGMNLGDEAILQCIITRLRASLPVEITVFTRNPEKTLKLHNAERAIPVRALSRDEITPEIERLDLFIFGGGGILFDGDVLSYLREVNIARDKGVPVMVYAIGAGPLNDPDNQRIVRENLNDVAVITVRERNAKKALQNAGVTRDIIITGDPALLMEPEPLPPNALHREGLDIQRRLIGISVREPGMAAPDINRESYHALLANAADYMVDRYGANIIFVPMERNTLDIQHSHAVMAQMLRPQHATVLKGDYTPGQMLDIMKRFFFAVGMRLHFLIFAAIQRVPFIALPYASKVAGFLEELQIETPPLHLVNAGRLIAHIDSLWDRRSELIAHIDNILPELQARTRVNNDIAVNLLRKKRVFSPASLKEKERLHAGS